MRLGIDLGGTKIEAVAIDAEGRELLRQRIATPTAGYDATLDSLRGLVVSIEARLGPAASVGIGTPGSVSPSTGLIRNSNSLALNGRPFVKDLSALLMRPIHAANDANCFTLSEAVDGAGAKHAIVFGVILGTGVGGGLSIDKKIWTGRNAIAGEWGHNSLPRIEAVDLPTRACYCGRSGCIETYLCGPALSADHAAHLDNRIDSRPIEVVRIVQAARAGERQPQAALQRYYRRLAKSLASVINIVDPDVIVLGGGLSNIDELYTAVPALLPEFVFSDEVTTPIVRNQHGDASGVRGAAWLAGAAADSDSQAAARSGISVGCGERTQMR